MALKGNLSHFGIADVLQLIGTQNKTAILSLQHHDETVKMHFLEGQLVKSEHLKRQRQELLGNMLLRSELISPSQLQQAIGSQKILKMPLGQLLIEMKVLLESDLMAFLKLQSTETVYRAFLWNEGTYHLETNQQVTPSHPPIRAEVLLMEGFRQRDEWPMLRQLIPSYRATFAIRTALEEFLLQQEQTDSSPEADPFDMGWEGESEAQAGDENKQISSYERLIYSLIAPDRDLQKIIDLGRLGEFSTCQAIADLLKKGVIEIQAMAHSVSAEPVVGGIEERKSHQLSFEQKLAHVLYVAFAGILFVVVWWSRLGFDHLWYDKSHVAYPQALLMVQEANRQRLVQDIAYYQSIHAELPVSLQHLSAQDCLSWAGWQPCHQVFLYKADKTSYRLFSLLP